MDTNAVLERFWALMASNDFASVAEVLHPDFCLHWPQSGERIRGATNFAGMNQHYPAHGPWQFELRRLLVDGTRGVTEVAVTDGVQRGLALSFFELADGLIRDVTEYWPEPFPAPPERARWVEST
ncbi:polyketide cyclase [Ahniella affigens]|uniref:Polyketide cyclase n=1 Tax=Ahniella affigens TaxID=2021234 RepID=A0A2P1PVK5_9GAMM|nr:nuclear transport factor 2 family protein [Ahniella affigens]AVP98878.1 polyketide cyclase [Ahniella affigens]